MAQPYHNSTSSFQEDHQHYQLFNFDQISSSLSLSCPVFVNDHLYPPQLPGQTYFTEAPQHFQLALQLKADQMVPCGGSCDLLGATTAHDHEKQSKQYADSSLKLKIWKSSDHEVLLETNDGTDDHHENTINSFTKWISSKRNPSDQITNSDMAIVNCTTTRKFEDTKKYPTSPLAATDQINNSSSPTPSSSNTPIRVCADCHTTKTPLWRSGPRGPKTLCNACGIRQRKARRAMAAAASGTIIKVEKSSKEGRSSTVQKKEKKPTRNKNNNRSCLPFKKRCKLNSPSTRGRKKKQVGSNFEELAIRVNQNINSAYQLSVFPQDEKEAAILLMALSYGLVNG